MQRQAAPGCSQQASVEKEAGHARIDRPRHPHRGAASLHFWPERTHYAHDAQMPCCQRRVHSHGPRFLDAGHCGYVARRLAGAGGRRAVRAIAVWHMPRQRCSAASRCAGCRPRHPKPVTGARNQAKISAPSLAEVCYARERARTRMYYGERACMHAVDSARLNSASSTRTAEARSNVLRRHAHAGQNSRMAQHTGRSLGQAA